VCRAVQHKNFKTLNIYLYRSRVKQGKNNETMKREMGVDDPEWDDKY
jgi:hypothetical protein